MSSRDVPPPPETEKPRAPIRPEGTVTNISDELWVAVHELLASQEFAKHVPKFMEQGGENLVFFVEEKDAIVCKVNFAMTLPVLRQYAKAKDSVERQRVLEEGRQVMQERMADRADKLRTLRSYFGAEAVPVEQNMIRVLPISQAVIKALGATDIEAPAFMPNYFPVWLTVQRKVPNIKQGISLSGSYIERPLLRHLHEHGAGRSKSDFSPQNAQHWFTREHELLTGPPTLGARRPEDMPLHRSQIFHAYPNMEKVWRAVTLQGSSFRRTLRTTLEIMMEYINETGENLDLAGVKNVALVPFVSQDKTEWKVKMLDPLDSGSLCTVSAALEAAREFEQTGHLSRNAFLRLVNVLNTVRVINALAFLTNTPDRLYFKEFASLDTESWLKEWQRQGVVEM